MERRSVEEVEDSDASMKYSQLINAITKSLTVLNIGLILRYRIQSRLVFVYMTPEAEIPIVTHANSTNRRDDSDAFLWPFDNELTFSWS